MRSLKEPEVKQLTEWLNPTEITETSYGAVFNSIWLENEQQRLNKDIPCYAHRRTDMDGYECIMVRTALLKGKTIVTGIEMEKKPYDRSKTSNTRPSIT